jgi:hypothetical protein
MKMITPRDIRLAVMTVSRSPEYIHTTLASLLLSDPLAHCLKGLHLVVGSAEANYLKHYGHHCRMEVHVTDEQDCQRLQEWTPHRRFCFNYHRCLTILPADCHGICICEDDVIFRDHFVETLVAAINEIEQENGVAKYLLDLYIPDTFKRDPSCAEGKHWVKYDAESYYGTQCMFFPRSIVPEVAWMMHRFGVADYRAPGDLIIRQYALMTNSLYGTKQPLVQHIGLHSTGLAEFFHRSAAFDEYP